MQLSKCSSTVKASAYLTLVRPTMEYVVCVWDPYEEKYIQLLEKIQHRAAWWILSDYRRQSSMTAMLTQLGWPTLLNRRLTSRLTFFYRIIHGDLPLNVPPYYLKTYFPIMIIILLFPAAVLRHAHINIVFTPVHLETGIIYRLQQSNLTMLMIL